MNPIRKYIILTLALLITLSASGVSISMHRCCGKIKDLSILGSLGHCKMSSATNIKSVNEKKHAFNPKHKGLTCCSDQKISIQKTDNATVQKNQVKEKANFDVLFVLTFVRNWLGYSSQDEDTEDEDSTPSISLSESLTILFRQFRI